MRKLLIPLTAIIILACAGGGKEKMPDWVKRGPGAFPGDEGKYIYGVGVADWAGSVAMTYEKANHRARVELARAIKTYVAAMVKDFMESYPEYFTDEAKVHTSEYTMKISKEISEATLRGAVIIDHWPDEPKPGKPLYALARVEKGGGVDEWIKKHIQGLILKAKAEAALEELDKELKKVDLREKENIEKYLGVPMSK